MSGQTVYVVYADILFFINFCIDFICLYLSAKLCACPAGIARTALASALGGLYAIAALALDVLPVPAKLPLHLLAAFVICFAAFFRGDWKKLLISCGLFVVSNALMGGLLTAVYTLSGKYAHYNGGLLSPKSAPEALSPSRWRARSARGCSAFAPSEGSNRCTPTWKSSTMESATLCACWPTAATCCASRSAACRSSCSSRAHCPPAI